MEKGGIRKSKEGSKRTFLDEYEEVRMNESNRRQGSAFGYAEESDWVEFLIL